jgi:predicted dehydrogenase
VEKTGTKQGWSHPASDEDWQHGYPHEFQDFVQCLAHNREPLSSGDLARDTIAVLYSAYVSAERRGMEVEVPPEKAP